ncbi:MAG: YesL family protein [Lachnospiraceae bacterium]|nr:YesL family protein [Lachnospiraceae bacterium]
MHFFDPDSPLMNGLSRMTDLVLLNLITLAACLPVFTAGASLTAMHYVLLKMVRGEEGYVARDWLKSFKQNFREASLIWLLFLAAGLMALLDIWMAAYGEGGAALALRVLLILVILIAYADFLWAFPLLSRFEGTVPGILSAAMAMAFRAFPKTLAMGAAGAMPLIIWIFFPSMAPLVLLFGASLPGLISAYMYSPLFKKLEKEREKGEEDPEKIYGKEDQAL